MSKKKATATSLPLSRVQKIMVSTAGVDSVNQDIVALATKATEIFLMDFARRAYDQSSDEEFKSNVLDYSDLQKLAHGDDRYDFLKDVLPKKIKFSEALKKIEENRPKHPPIIMKGKKSNNNTNSRAASGGSPNKSKSKNDTIKSNLTNDRSSSGPGGSSEGGGDDSGAAADQSGAMNDEDNDGIDRASPT